MLSTIPTSLLLALIPACIMGSLIQSVTGFGLGIFVMTIFPYFMPYVIGVTLSTCFSVAMTTMLSFQLRRHIPFHLEFVPLCGYFITCGGCILLSISQTDAFLTRLLGGFLILLSLYLMFFSDKIKIKPTKTNGFIAGLISGALSGMFGAGGPPMVVYFMATTDSPITYLAAMQFFFSIANIFSLSVRYANGLVTPYVGMLWVLGLAGVAVGATIGRKIVGKVDGAMLRKLVYGFMAISGAIMLFNS